MKNPVHPHTVVCLFLSTMASLPAQNLAGNPQSPDPGLDSSGSFHPQIHRQAVSFSPGSYQIPAFEKVRGEILEAPPVMVSQDSRNLDQTLATSRGIEAVVDLDVLNKPSPYRRMVVQGQTAPHETEADSLGRGLAHVSAAYREMGQTGDVGDCPAISLSVEQHTRQNPSRVLELVESEISANPGCACEIVKAAIQASEADVPTVVAIVEAAILASPESMRMVSQCAIAASPESLAEVQSLLAKLDPNAGDGSYSSKGAKSAKSAKTAKVASIVAPPPPNPLDRPPPGPPIPPIPPIDPDPVTSVDPCRHFRGVAP